VTATAGATASPAGAAIETRGLTKRFGSILALDRLDLAVPRGSIFGLLGPNGAGKTTTIRILAGLARPTAGSASVAGVPVGLGQPELRRRLGYLDQDPRFYSWMKGRELLELVGRLHGLGGAELRSHVAGMLERTGLVSAADRRIGGYSGGMRQRLGIAQALVHAPELLILDEPVSSLDPEGRRDLLELVAGLRGEATVVFSTHVLADVERICDRVAILDRGRRVTEGPLEELLAAHARPIYNLDPAPRQDAAVAALVARLRAAPWTTDVTATPVGIRVTVADPDAAAGAILPLVVACGVVLESFERARPTLEDVFLELVGNVAAEDLDGRGFVRPREVRDR
jgi:ABC-2 type transport system ATP-binding protein